MNRLVAALIGVMAALALAVPAADAAMRVGSYDGLPRAGVEEVRYDYHHHRHHHHRRHHHGPVLIIR